jgi:hypothetical protein
VEELRLPQRTSAEKPNQPALLSTNGFPTLLLIFHPLHQSNYRFQMEADNGEDGVWCVRFEHIPGMRSTSAVMIQGRIYPLDLQGMARIERDTGTILNISARLIAPMKDINIEDFRIEVTYKPQTFSTELAVRWLPSKTVIELETALQHWRNIHSYSQYRRFDVQAVQETSR